MAVDKIRTIGAEQAPYGTALHREMAQPGWHTDLMDPYGRPIVRSEEGLSLRRRGEHGQDRYVMAPPRHAEGQAVDDPLKATNEPGCHQVGKPKRWRFSGRGRQVRDAPVGG